MNNSLKTGIDSKETSLTKYPRGTLAEFWSISWPLMLGFLSNNAMIFIDRLYLAHYSIQALNAVANSSLAYYCITVIPMAVSAITEVLIGHLGGAKKYSEIGGVVWQMLWLSLFIAPFFWATSKYLSPYIFFRTGNEVLETIYFSTLLTFASFACANMALNSFFIGLGKIKVVAIATLVGNFTNIVLGFFLILGFKSFLGMGVRGAGLAMGIAQIVQFLVLFLLFYNKKHIVKYGVARLKFNFVTIFECLKLGFPAGSAHFMEVVAHFIFFRILIKSQTNSLTVVVLVQSFSIFVAFLIEAQSKSVTALISNLIGSSLLGYIPKVLKSAFTLHSILFIALLSLFLFVPEGLFNILISKNQSELIGNTFIKHDFNIAFIWMLLFFLLDGFSWILIGYLTSIKDTIFICICSTIIHWFFYLPFAYLLLIKMQMGTSFAWMSTTLCAFMHFIVFLIRYRFKYYRRPKVELLPTKFR